ncbi:MAG: citramalate synthase, partial [Candidatus Hydrogenedentes bacterium]|nr:citramalate synthase [Candidatus Hydrogenedentota bacterium]
VREVRDRVPSRLGIHTHNDSGTAVGGTLMAVENGVTHVQGTLNGYGERCGNADLCSIIPNLALKMGRKCVSRTQLKRLTTTAHFVSELANIVPDDHQPYVGRNAFTHKAGMHVSAVKRAPESFEHAEPDSVGNQRHVVVSEVSGAASVSHKARELGIELEQKSDETKQIVNRIKELEDKGYLFEGADASFELVVKKVKGLHQHFFDLAGFRVIVERKRGEPSYSEATIKVVVDGREEHTAAEGDGPVDALDHALRKALERFYPDLKQMHLADFKVRVLDARAGTAAKTRVLIESMDEDDSWNTVGVSENIIEACYEALVDSIEYKLLKDRKRKRPTK